ncbi:MAG: Holliday junction branch migration protein RuvA [Candidatus Cloacimonetes bacterium]|nr:Holliday junction branch migration protein RuvA [Candidatus Cloacimonadota bacterium]
MISYISGVVAAKTPVSVVIETTSGVAFAMEIPVSTFENLPAVGQSCTLHTHLHYAQDDIRMFGFFDPAERQLFQILTSVSGIGPKTGLSILSTLPVPTFVRAIEHQEEGILTRIPGIGKKSAQRLILELGGKLSPMAEHFKSTDHVIERSVMEEVESALVTLGFNAKEIHKELALMPEEAKQMAPEALIKETIRRIYQRSK